MAPPVRTDCNEYREDYPENVYIAYAKSIGLGIERRVMDCPPKRPAEFWRQCTAEIDSARWRMRNVNGELRRIKGSYVEETE